ncbi:hypothetical protein I302_103124 [Kwoniella bestiolae CBS 10118]|uniref:Uncharacterized protein n=1 Tax=Kwoniella bestiolae CBS 10118 TaxID=1296100 RepID=A0A1B9GH22_9TREE|nr:hypothetical protein I302_01824 [Kwoniella bestiolae CBS 10118]OCF30305.1 hypothetical protein I302_01824 [Kwoniella bestiolae CBS 10118]
MVHPIPLTPRWIILYTTILLSAISLWFMRDDQGGFSSLNSLSNPFSSNQCPSSCRSDPFSQRGILTYPSVERYNETRWIPLPPFSSDNKVKLSNIDYTGNLPPELEAGLAEQLTARLNQQEENQLADTVEWEWLKGRLVVFLDDRNNVEQLCGEIHGKSESWGGHVGGFCHVERIDLTLVWWFSYGLVDDESLDLWRKLEARPITFENRIKEVFLPAMKSDGIDRTPDLMVVSSLFWDEGFIRDYPQLYPPTPPLPPDHRNRPGFLPDQIQWHQSRLAALFTYLREIYNQPDLPLMFRTRHIRANMNYGGGLKIAQIDQGAREVCEAMGVKLFRWGDLLEGVSDYYDKDQHFPLGPNTYLFGE